MLHELVLAHAASPNAAPLAARAYEWSWQTCLRKIILSRRETLVAPLPASAWELYHAEGAYQFLLEIICGLHSPLLGETEVLGQFRAYCAAAGFPKNHWGQFLRQLTTDLMRDAKRIRHEHLQHLGHRSYGSVACALLDDMPRVAVLGAGQLAQEMLPALLEQSTVEVFARDAAKAQKALRQHNGLTVYGLAEAAPPSDAKIGLIIAAPLPAAEIAAWAQRQSASFPRVLDLRGASATDPLALPFAHNGVIDLREFFARVQAGEGQAAARAGAARAACAQLAERQTRQVQCRPWGWEDVYA